MQMVQWQVALLLSMHWLHKQLLHTCGGLFTVLQQYLFAYAITNHICCHVTRFGWISDGWSVKGVPGLRGVQQHDSPVVCRPLALEEAHALLVSPHEPAV
jgi:hypothetical protein